MSTRYKSRKIAERDAEIERLRTELDMSETIASRTMSAQARFDEHVSACERVRLGNEECIKIQAAKIATLKATITDLHIAKGVVEQSLAQQDAEIERLRRIQRAMTSTATKFQAVMREVAAGDGKAEPRQIADDEGEAWCKRKIDELEAKQPKPAEPEAKGEPKHEGKVDPLRAAQSRVWKLTQERDAARAEADRLQKLFDDAGEGNYNVLALVDHYADGERFAREEAEKLREQLAKIREVLK